MKNIFAKIHSGLRKCHYYCDKHPRCKVFATNFNIGEDELACIDCVYADDCAQSICLYCHPFEYQLLQRYHKDMSEPSFASLCNDVEPLKRYSHFDSFRGASVPYLTTEIVDLILDLLSLPCSSPDYFWGSTVQSIQQAALAYIDYVLLRRKLDRDCSIDFLELCKKLGVKYNQDDRWFLQDHINYHEYQLLVGQIDDSSLSYQKESQPNEVDAPVSLFINQVIDYPKIVESLDIREDHWGLLKVQLKEMRDQYKAGTKGKTKVFFSYKDCTLVGQLLFKKKKEGAYLLEREFVKRFLNALRIYNQKEVKIYDLKKENLDWIFKKVNSLRFILPEDIPTDNPR